MILLTNNQGALLKASLLVHVTLSSYGFRSVPRKVAVVVKILMYFPTHWGEPLFLIPTVPQLLP